MCTLTLPVSTPRAIASDTTNFETDAHVKLSVVSPSRAMTSPLVVPTTQAEFSGQPDKHVAAGTVKRLLRSPKVSGVIVVLSGGVGAARLLRALRHVHDPAEVIAIVNVGDDLVLHGLTICPDLDTITYTLAGLHNDVLGWGLAGESWRVRDELQLLGGQSWFALGDRDLATHLYRTQRLNEGATKSEVTAEISTHFGLPETLLPASNDLLRTEFETDAGHLSFQEYFVAHHHNVTVTSVSYVGAETAQAAPGVLRAIENADRIVIAPSNPLISIEPILQVRAVRDAVRARRSDVVAISPLIRGSALKGPADRLMRELGEEASCVGVARRYQTLVSRMIIDELDAERAREIEELAMEVTVTTTVMSIASQAQALATAVVR